jgi:hypothetical protein
MTSPSNPLIVYPAPHSSSAVQGIDVSVDRNHRPGALRFQYVLRADISQLAIPPTRASGRADSLWKHTCFEAFITSAGATGSGYYELNFSPSRQWAIYRFSGYREGMTATEVRSPPELVVRRFDDRLELDAEIELAELADLPALRAGGALKLALSAVVEDGGGTLSYWALKHPPGKPDFHHADGFVLELLA